MNPSVLFVSSLNSDLRPLIRSVINLPELPESVTVNENIISYDWHIDNKYYSSDVRLCIVKEKCISDETFADSVQAIVIEFNSKDTNGLTDVESWLPFLNVYDAEIKILVCDRCLEDSGALRRSVLEWCVARGFELVETDPDVSEIDPEDDFPETLGVERIRQALNAHSWPNLVLKNAPKYPGVSMRRLVNLVGDADEEDEFGELLSHLNEMKTQVGHLSGNERKAAAEKVVKAFWEAIGGDEDDLGSLSDVSI